MRFHPSGSKILHSVYLLSFFYCSTFLFSQSGTVPIDGQEQLVFEQLSVEHGLSQSSVTCILQDKNGFLWFGTDDGLNRYDGYDIRVYTNNPSDPNSLSHNAVRTLIEDHEGNLWIGTFQGGLNRYNPLTEQFTSYQHDPGNPHSIVCNNVLSILEDSAGRLWIGTPSGLELFNKDRDRFLHFIADANDPNGLVSSFISELYEDHRGRLWIGTVGGGIHRIITNENDDPRFERYRNIIVDGATQQMQSVRCFHEDPNGRLWVGTGRGLIFFNPEADQFELIDRYENGSLLQQVDIRSIAGDEFGGLWVGMSQGLIHLTAGQNPYVDLYQSQNDQTVGIPTNSILSVYRDRSNVLWAGTFGAGLSKIKYAGNVFEHQKSEFGNPNSLSNNIIWALHEDRVGDLWIGTNGGGLNRYNRQSNRYTHYRHNPSNPNSIGRNTVRAIHQDRQGDLWLGLSSYGLDRLPLEEIGESDPSFIHFRDDVNDPFSLARGAVLNIHEDSTGGIWLAMNRGLARYIKEIDGFILFSPNPANPASLIDDRIWDVTTDQTGLLWVAINGGGLCSIPLDSINAAVAARNPDLARFRRYQQNSERPGHLSSNGTLCLHEDSQGRLWIGTSGGGVNRFDRITQTFRVYTQHDGLANNTVYGILEDDEGCLWFSTNNGLSRYNPENDQFKNFSVSDGLQSSEFNVGAFDKGRDGRFYFGGINGFNIFHPGSIEENPIPPQTVITDLQIFNQSVPAGIEFNGRVILETSITSMPPVDLNYNENVITLQFAGLHFYDPKRNTYRYMLEGLDKVWNDAGTRRFVTYSALPPGEYTFQVMAANCDGVWNEEAASLQITIHPPIWQTTSFKGLAAIVILMTAFIWYRKRIQRIEARRKELERQVEEKTAAALALQAALDEVKMLKNRLEAENIYLQDEIKFEHNFSNIICRSEPLKKVLRQVEQVASTDSTVLVLGESGTGKELLARAVHDISTRKDRPLVKVDCSVLPTNLIESELFGHEKGAFTGAIQQKIGRFQLADGGTIFLDEIGDLPLEVQAKLLRVLQDGEFERLGGTKTIKIDVRVIAATHHDLENETASGRFREDLFYRLNVFPIRIPPLRKRKDDIPILVNHFVQKYSKKVGRPIEYIPQSVIDQFIDYSWPGNVRELENIVERAVIISRGKTLEIGEWLQKTDDVQLSTAILTLEENERRHIIKALETTAWRVSGEKGAAKILGVNAKTLESRMKKLNIHRESKNS